MKPGVLVTGSTGRIGREVVAALLPDWTVKGFDRRTVDSLGPEDLGPRVEPHEFILGSLENQAAIGQALNQVECVVHLAAKADDDPLPDGDGRFRSDDDNFAAELGPANLMGAYNVLKAAVRAGTRRVVLVSSLQVIRGRRPDPAVPLPTDFAPLGADTPYAPRYLYACTKVFLEALGRVFAKERDLEVLVVRVGGCPRDQRGEDALQRDPWGPSEYLSGPDAGRFFAAALRHPFWPRTADADGRSFAYGIVQVTSKPPVGKVLYDLTAAKALGYVLAD
jgi:nucleoside-diphosphate-sugar epimerase